jgi:hypothetical protein
MISGFQCGVNEVFAAAGCHTTLISGLLAMFRGSLLVLSLATGTDRLSYYITD